MFSALTPHETEESPPSESSTDSVGEPAAALLRPWLEMSQPASHENLHSRLVTGGVQEHRGLAYALGVYDLRCQHIL
jgi:hypothetical protein